MRVLFINEMCGTASTGRITCELADQLTAEGHTCRIAYGRADVVPDKWRHYAVRIGTDMDVRLHALRTRILDECGFGSKKATKAFLNWADSFNPDLVWLHNLHGYYVNVEMLFEWIKHRPEMQIKWTLHDCWAFTGHCSYFSMIKCEQWMMHCSHCSQTHKYPASYGKDNCKSNFDRKRAAFTGVRNMTLITPSKWLADLTRQSFLKEYPVEVHYNTIDTNLFKPTPSDFRKNYNLQGKIIVLGVANAWVDRKGLNDFYKLAQILDEQYTIVLVGLNKKQLKRLPKNIYGIQRTNSPQELAAIYTAADVFCNPTYEDNYPTVNLEAQACGTPVIAYDAGGTKETIYNGMTCSVGSVETIASILTEGKIGYKKP